MSTWTKGCFRILSRIEVRRLLVQLYLVGLIFRVSLSIECNVCMKLCVSVWVYVTVTFLSVIKICKQNPSDKWSVSVSVVSRPQTMTGF